MRSKAQLTVFFVVVIVIAAVVFLSTQIQRQQVSKEPTRSNLNPETSLELRHYVENCLHQVGENAIYYVMLQGGYYYPATKSTPFYNVSIANYWEKNMNLMPSRDEIGQELSYFVEDNLAYCLNSLKDFEEQGFQVALPAKLMRFDDQTQDKIVEIILADLAERENGIETNVHSIITGNAVFFNLNGPISVTRGSERYAFDSFSSLVNINVNRMLELAETIMVSQQESPEYVPLSTIAELAYENDFRFEILHHSENIVLFGLFFRQPYGEELAYSFGSVYDWKKPNELSLEGST